MKSILNVDVSFYETLATTTPVTRKLFDLLTAASFAEQISAVRNEQDVDKRKALKKSLPSFTPSGVFATRRDDSLISHSGLICIDIDKKENGHIENFDKMKKLIAKVPFVSFCAHSVGGEGFYCIISIKYPDQHRLHFKSLQMDFARCGVTIDKSCINVGRIRFVSHDSEYYYNSDAVVYDMYVENAISRPQAARPIFKSSHVTPIMVDELISIIEEKEIDITERLEYHEWFAIGCSLANYFGEAGREKFHTVNQFHPRYSPSETDKKFNDALSKKYNYNIETFLYHAHKAGVTALADFLDIPKESK